jgi:regulator of protease activity HflC (stomatin/prohibitin superfamily)
MKIQEQTRNAASGYLALVILPALIVMWGVLIVGSVDEYGPGLTTLLYGLGLAATLVCLKGFFMVHPNQAIVLQLFGSYAGSVRQTGLRWANPFYSKHAVALRNMATSYPYEAHGGDEIALRSHPQEIASAMLKRQQAQAIVAARTQIVDGAVGMVKMALDQLREQGVVDLDEERKANMVSNLLVVLCGEENVRPVLNTGSLYG